MIAKTVSPFLIIFMMFFSSVENKTINTNTLNIENETAVKAQENFTFIHVYYNTNLTPFQVQAIRQEYLANPAISLHPIQPTDPYHDHWIIDDSKRTGGTTSIEATIDEDDRVSRGSGD